MADEQSDMDQRLDEIRALLQGGEIRIELGFSLSIMGARPTARLYRRNGNRWVKVDPLLLPPDGGTHADLLDLLAGLARKDDEQPAKE